MKRVIRASSRALGERCHVTVYVYDDLAAMRSAAEAYNGGDVSDVLGVTQARTDQNGRVDTVLIRLARGHLGTRIISHEMHHAATALYGSAVADRPSRRAHLNHYNEPFAHLYSDLLGSLVDRLYALGYYNQEAS